jgi:F-type H+-transporting ATPase subunit delta
MGSLREGGSPHPLLIPRGLPQENIKLRELLFNPVVENEKKRAVLVKIGKEAGFNQYTNNFLNLLLEKDRLPLLDEICESFEELYCQMTDTQVTARTGVHARFAAGGSRAGAVL